MLARSRTALVVLCLTVAALAGCTALEQEPAPEGAPSDAEPEEPPSDAEPEADEDPTAGDDSPSTGAEAPSDDASVELEVVQATRYTDDPYTHIVGLVENTADTNVTRVEVEANFTDSSGETVATDWTRVPRITVPAGERAPFEVFAQEAPDRIEGHELSAAGDPTDAGPTGHGHLQVRGVTTGQDDFGDVEILGDVENTAPESAHSIEVTAAFYDEEGRIQEMERTQHLKPYEVGAGERASFDISPDREELDVAETEFWVRALSMGQPIDTGIEGPHGSEAIDVEIVDKRVLRQDGSLRILGFLEVPGSEPASNIDLIATFHDEDGDVVERTQFDPLRFNTPAGEQTPFSLEVDDAAAIEDHRLDLVSFTDEKPFPPNHVSLEDVQTSTDAMGDLRIEGTMVNEGELTARSIRVVAYFTDDNGTLVEAKLGHPQARNLAPGEETEFTIPTDLDEGEVADHQVWADALSMEE